MDHAVATWVPVEVLVGALGLLLLVVWRMLEAKLKEIFDALKELKTAQNTFEKQFISVASLEQLGRLGDRFDGRITTLNQDLGKLTAEMTGIKAVIGK